MDYVALDNANNGYLWNFNNDYDSIDIGINYASVAFDFLAGYTNFSSPGTSEVDYTDFGFIDPYPSTLVLTIDSVWFLASHENNSGQYDKIKVELIELDAQGELNGPVLWSKTDSVNQGISPNNEYLEQNGWFYLRYAPGLITGPGQKIGMRVQYIDPTKSDSMAIYGGVRQVPVIGGITQPSAYPNSFVRFPYFWPDIRRNASSIYPTNGQYFLAQNWGFWMRVLVDAILPVPYESTSEDAVVFPNPATNVIHLMWNRAIGGNLDVNIYHSSGALVKSARFPAVDLSSDRISMDVSDLSSGFYQISMRSGNSVRFSKLTISK
jgi:hypothetical protein